MANTIKIKSGSGTPTTSDIQDKELAFDRSADRLYINDAGTIVDLTGSGATGDIEGVTAGNGLTGGGTSGTVTLNVDDVFLKNNADDTTSGTITAAGFTTSGSVTSDTLVGNSNNTNTLLFDDDQSGASNMVTLQSINHINVMTDGNNNGTGNFRVYNGSYDTDTADLAFAVNSNSNATFYGDVTLSGTGDLTVPGVIKHTGDSDTYIFFTNDRIRLYAGNTLKLDTDETYLTTAGTGIDISSATVSVDVSDFMTNGSNDRILTATGTDAMNAEANLTFSPSNNYLTVHEDGASTGSHLRLATDNSDFFLSASGSSNQLTIYDANAATNSLVMGSDGKITLRDSLKIPVGKSVFFGGSEHTYIREDIDDRLRFFTGGAEFMRFTEDTADSINLYQDVKLTATKKLYLDGGGNTYIFEESADNVIHYVGGQNKLRFNSTGTILNDAGLALDFRVEGDTDPNLFFVDGSADRVGIGTNSPGHKVHIDSNGSTNSVLRIDADDDRGASRYALDVQDDDANRRGVARFRHTTGSGNPPIVIAEGYDHAYIFQSKNTSASDAEQFRIEHYDGNVYIDSRRGNLGLYATGGNVVVNGTSNFTGEMYIDHGGSDYAPGINFMGGTNTPGSNTYENCKLAYYDNSGTGLMRYTIGRDAGSHSFRIGSSGEVFYVDASGQARITGATDINLVLTSTDSGGGLAIKDSNTSGDYYNGVFCSGNELFLKSNNSERVRIDDGGLVGIGTQSPSFKLKVNVDDGTYTNLNTIAGFQSKRGADSETEVGIAINSSGDGLLGSISSNLSWSASTASKGNTGRSSSEILLNNLGNDESTFTFRGQTYNSTSFVNYMKLDSSQSLQVLGDVVAYSTSVSDKRLKDNIKTIDNALDKVMALRGVEFDWNATSRRGQHDIGLVAQEVEKVIPEVVRENELEIGEFTDNEKTFKTIDYDKMVGVLVEAIKEQQQQINELKEKLNG